MINIYTRVEKSRLMVSISIQFIRFSKIKRIKIIQVRKIFQKSNYIVYFIYDKVISKISSIEKQHAEQFFQYSLNVDIVLKRKYVIQ